MNKISNETSTTNGRKKLPISLAVRDKFFLLLLLALALMLDTASRKEVQSYSTNDSYLKYQQ